jgi:glycosyltransferase involved in cell wall biosynthesis
MNVFTMQNKIRVAFIKFGGLSAGGTEKFLQTIAANLDPTRFAVTYFYCDTAPCIGSDYIHPGTDSYRIEYLQKHHVKMVEFRVGAKDITHPLHPWVATDFWEKFKESDFDIIQTGRGGYKEYPFNKIKKTPIVDSLHLSAGVDNQYNIARVMHICNWNVEKWKKAGGDVQRSVLVSHPMEIDTSNAYSLREQFGIDSTIKIFGFHQRNADGIFSPIPLQAYKQIESADTHFMLMGGSTLYRDQAKTLGIKNITFIDHSAEQKQIYSFLKTLDVYAHGRKDGEVNSTAMAEAMYFGLPIVSHTSQYNNGHIECIGEAGMVVPEEDVDAYAAEMGKLKDDSKYYAYRSKAAKERFQENYELNGQMKRIEAIYDDVIRNPFPYPLRRFIYSLHWTQNIRIWLKYGYLKIKFMRNGKI